MQFVKGRRAWLVGGFIGYVLLAIAWSVAAGVSASPKAGPATVMSEPAQLEEAEKVFTEPTYSSPIAISADRNWVWVVNPDDDSVSVINATTDEVVAKISNVGDEPQSIAVDPDNQYAYVANAASNNVTIIRVTNLSPFGATVVKRFTTGAEPWNVVISPDGRRVFVANSAQDTITVLKADVAFPTLPTIVGNLNLRSSTCNVGDPNRHFQPRGMAVTLASDRLFVTRFLSFTGGANPKQATNDGKVGVVCRIDLPASVATLPTVFTPITLGAQPSGFPAGVNELAYPNQMQSIVIRGDNAYLPNIAAAPAAPLLFNADTQSYVNRITGITGAPADGGAINMHLGARDPELVGGTAKTKLFFANPWAIAFDNQAGAGSAYAVSAGSDLLVKLTVSGTGVLSFTVDANTTRYIDLNDPNSTATSGIKAGKNPLGIVLRNIAPGNKKAYVMNYISRNVSVVNLDTDEVSKVIALTELPPPNSQEEVLQVGKEIFFSSRGVFNGGKFDRLSSEGWQNCASCHFNGLTDSNVWAFGTGPRKSVPMNGTWSPHNPDDQRVLNYSAIFDEVQDFELNIRAVSGPGNLPNTNPPQLDPNHGLLIGDDGNIDAAPGVVNAFAKPNGGRPQLTVTLPSFGAEARPAIPALDALKEWVRFAIRTPNGVLTDAELLRDPAGPDQGNVSTVGGINQTQAANGRRLFFQAGCQFCHGGTKWTNSNKDFISPPAAADIFCETAVAGGPPGCQAAAPGGVTPVNNQFLNRFLSNIDSFGLGTAEKPFGANVGGAETAANGQLGLGKDHNGDGKGDGFNIPSLLGIWSLQPYYHNGACETLECVLSNQKHRTANGTRPDVLSSPASQLAVVEFLRTLDAQTEFPTDLKIVRHNIFFDPPVVFKGTTVTVGANISLFGTKADLESIFGANPLRVKFSGPGLDAVVDLPLTAFDQDFGQATATTTWNVPDNVTLANVTVTIDPDNFATETNENNNSVSRRIILRNPPPDTVPPTVDEVSISDDTPFNDDDAITNTRDVQVKFRVTNTPSVAPSPTTDLQAFCIVRYSFDPIERRWVEEPCTNFLPLPAPNGDGSFTVNARLPVREGTAYAFVWVRDAEGNISKTPGFDFISFVPGPDVNINVNRNDIRIFRIKLDAGQALNFTFTPTIGDIDVSVFDSTGTRIAVSANNGLTPETASLLSNTDGSIFQIEVRAVVNSRFTIATSQSAVVNVDARTAITLAPGKADLPETPTNLGPPPLRAAIETGGDIFLPLVVSP